MITKTQTLIAGQNLQNILQDISPTLRERVLLCAHERQVPVELPLFVGLAAISASVGKGVAVRSGQNRYTRANLFILLGVASGIGKSEVFRDMFGPILDFEDAMHEWWRKESSPRARAGEELLKAQIANLRKATRTSPMVSLKIFREMQSSEVKRDICRSYLEPPYLLVDDATPESAFTLMATSNESIAMVSPDARYLLKRLSRPDSKEENFLLKAFSGDLSVITRITRKSTRLNSPCLTTLLLTQQDAYQSFLQKSITNRSGLLPRFLHAAIDANNDVPSKVDGRKRAKIRKDYRNLLKELIETHRFEKTPRLVEPSESAEAYLQQIEKECRNNATTGDSLHSEIIRRRAEQIWRISLCLHLARHGNSAALNIMGSEVPKAATAIIERLAPTI